MNGRRIGLLLGSAALAAVLGCGGDKAPTGKKQPAPKGDSHETLQQVVAELNQVRDTIRDAFEADKPEDGHDALHDVGHLLEHIEPMTAELPEDQRAAAKQATDKLFELYGKVDDKLHNKSTGVEYSEVSAEIDASIKTLNDIVSGGPAAPKEGEPKEGEPKEGEPKEGEK